MRIFLPQEVSDILSVLGSQGYEAYAVGGCIRDSLLGKKPLDWDITTSAKPEEVISCFSEDTVLKTGIQHGTVTLLRNRTPYEITTYRTEIGYQDHRHPDKVHFVSSLREDLKRRDFTVNAMAYSSASGLVDYFEGQKALKEKIIRTVGDPKERFTEDSLRILRALRFASVLGFTIEEKTALQVRQMAGTLSYVARERILSEWRKLLCGQAAASILSEYADVWKELFCFSSVKEAAKMIDCLPADFALHSAAIFLCENTSPEEAVTWMKAQKYDSKTIAEVLNLLKAFAKGLPQTTIELKKHLLGLDLSVYENVLSLYRAWCTVFSQDKMWQLLQAEKLFADLEKEKLCLSVKDLDISGKDLLRMEIPAGKEIGNCLNFLLNEIAEERLENKKEVLLKAAKNFFDKKQIG